MEIVKIGAHVLGIPAMAITLLNVDFNTWQGWTALVISSLYGLSFTIIYIIKGIQSIRRENFEHKMRKRKAV